MSSIGVLPNLDPNNYSRSVLHAEDRVWIEKNCYVDIWIEVLQALKLEATAIMPFTMAIDFEGDQWTFFKPPHGELFELYGIDVQELTVWRPLIEHAVEHLSAGKMISTEADAFWLPDTSGTDYRTQHTKSTIVINELDIDAQRLGYFHNAGYYALQGEDFIKTFRLDVAEDPTFMPFFAESIRIDRLVHRPTSELAALSWKLLQKHVSRIPQSNPVKKFSERFARDLPSMQELGLRHYHAWAFAATRQLGAAFEVLAMNLKWLESNGYAGLSESALAFEEISNANKAFILKGARAVNAKRTLDIAATFDSMIAAWDRGMHSLRNALA